MDVRILGPVEVWDEGRRCECGGSTQRALLVDLVLHANEVVPADRLIDDLWGDSPSHNAATALRVTVSRLRRALPPEAITTRSPGYMIRIGRDQLDVFRFDRLVEDARTDLARGSPEDASDRLGRALSLWRGPALADVAYESFAQAAIARLEESRLTALEMRIEADLALCRHRELVGELDALVAEHPLRERLRGHLMLALYRCGRQGDALRAFRETRRVLVEELGIDPSPALQHLERAILQQDPSLGVAAAGSRQDGSIPERSILLGLHDGSGLDALLPVAEPLASTSSRVMILARIVGDGRDLQPASTALNEQRAALLGRGVVARAASFTSAGFGAELARLAAELDAELLLTQAPAGFLSELPFDADVRDLLASAPCDVALLVAQGGGAAPGWSGAVVVPFGATENDWAALELGAWLASAHDVPLRLAGAAAAPERRRRDASRLLGHASLAVQRVLGVPTESLLTEPGEDGVLEASRDAGVLVVGLSDRWDREGLGPARLRIAQEARPPTLFVRRGLRRGGLSPPGSLTRFPWSIRT